MYEVLEIVLPNDDFKEIAAFFPEGEFILRRGRDSNSRRAYALSGFQDRRTRPTMRPLRIYTI